MCGGRIYCFDHVVKFIVTDKPMYKYLLTFEEPGLSLIRPRVCVCLSAIVTLYWYGLDSWDKKQVFQERIIRTKRVVVGMLFFVSGNWRNISWFIIQWDHLEQSHCAGLVVRRDHGDWPSWVKVFRDPDYQRQLQCGKFCHYSRWQILWEWQEITTWLWCSLQKSWIVSTARHFRYVYEEEKCDFRWI
jgi:hypothetical protein